MPKKSWSRREFTTAIAAGLGMATSSRGFSAGLHARRPPNILVIMSDEHNARVLGCMGDPIVKTPSLDALASSGIVLEHCYCNSPLCVPSRLSFTSGKYASRVGGWSNNCRLPSADYPSLPRVVQSAGFETYLCGKMHYDPEHRYGFTEVGGTFKTNMHKVTGLGKRRAANDLEPEPGYSERFKHSHPGDSSPVLDHDRQVTAGAVDFLKARQATDAPFLLVAGYLAPHPPFTVPESHVLPYRGKVPMPVIPAGHLDRLALNHKHLRIAFNVEDVPEGEVRNSRELYYGLVQWVDDEIGKVLAALADSEFAENTMVVYTSDHGENMGEHGMWWKNCAYDTATRVPLIVSWPARWHGGQRRTQVCSLVDVVQTIVEIAGATSPPDWDGNSMLAWLDDAATPWKDMAVSEYYAHNTASGYAMIRKGAYKYVYHTRPSERHEPERELYNLVDDPTEFANLVADQSHRDTVRELHAALLDELGEDPERTEARCRADYARGYLT